MKGIEGKRGRGRPTARLIVLGLIATSATAATASIAAGALKEKSASVQLDAADTGSATAKCKKGTRAVSGGFDDPTFNAEAPASGSYGQTFTSQRTSKREWTSVVSNGLAEATDAFTYAYCSDELPRLKAVSATTTIPESEVDSVTARCPRGGEAVSGGFAAEQLNPFDGVYPLASHRAGKRKWVASGYSSPISEPEADLTVYAYCAKKKLGLKTRSESASREDASENLSLEARCKKRERVVSGGFAGPLEVFTGFVDPFESRRTSRRAWTASTAAYGDLDFEAFAYCLKKEKKG
jgi:hypothetical protein